jgi:selenocysteine lyase/cysteine desulfurase
LDNVRAYHDKLIDRLITSIDHNKYDFISPLEGGRRSSLVVISHKDKRRNELIKKDLIDLGIFTAYWRGSLRLAPHVYNTEEEIDKAAEALNSIGK